MSPTETSARDDVVRLAVLGDAPDLGVLEVDPGFRIERFERLDELLTSGRKLQPRVAFVEQEERDETAIAETIKTLRRELPLTDVVVHAPRGQASHVRAALLAGARDVFLGSATQAEINQRLHEILDDQTLLPRLLEEDRRGGTWRFEGLISRSQKMWNIFETCVRTAGTDASVLILGETGTGKELIARAIHSRSGRKGPFVPLNCGAVPDTLIDSELFGHTAGAFTGAGKAKDGLFRHADGGTLFLDEIGNVPLSAQNRLLRTLQESTVRPLGGHDEIPIDVRVIAATSAPLELEIEQQRFREDLFYRLDVIRLILPPLRERPEDIIFLLGRFTHQLSEDYYVRRPEIGEEFLERVCAYEWPGNVRELENFVERLVITHPGERLIPEHFDEMMQTYRGRQDEEAPPTTDPQPLTVDLSQPLSETLRAASDQIERRYVEAALRYTHGRIGEAATLAGIHRRTLLRKLKQHDIDKSTFRPRDAPRRE
ncbi:MAG: sigma-54 dependent transcriptional regulator [Planctomycetota bacterium]